MVLSIFLKGRETVITVDVYGGLKEGDLSTGLAQVTSLVLMSTRGEVLHRLNPLFILQELQEYETSTILPAEGMYKIEHILDLYPKCWSV